MKVMPIMAQSSYSSQNKTNANYSTPAYTNYADKVSFSGKENFLNKILNSIKPKKAPQQLEAVEAKLVDTNIFFSKLEELQGKDGFKIYTPSGELLHDQKPESYELTAKTLKQIKGNIVLLSQESGTNISDIVGFWERGATHLFSSDKGLKKYFAFTFPEFKEKTVKKAQTVYDTISEKVSLDLEQFAINKAFKTGKPVFINGEELAPTLEKNYIEYFTTEMGIKKREVALDPTK